jgi:hypothetical protein
VHVARSVVYAMLFAIVPNVRLTGAFYAAFVLLLVIDVAVAAIDVALEPASRRAQGGLRPGEYFMHIVLSVLAGAYLHAMASSTAAWRTLPTAVTFEPHAPPLLRVALAVMALGAFTVAICEGAAAVAALPPRPIHVAVTLRTTRRALWDFTQDHRVHPDWDHRFSRIVMHDDVIRTGASMTYEKSILGIVTIRGWGRYKLHKPHAQSTFAFGSDDARSLIRRGVGVWLYRDRADGLVDFSTSYTYEVRWGIVGRIFDRLVFRPLFQRETERSFRRLARRFADDPLHPSRASRVRGARGRKPERAEALA